VQVAKISKDFLAKIWQFHILSLFAMHDGNAALHMKYIPEESGRKKRKFVERRSIPAKGDAF
jgi:hypothetical protein